MTTIACFSKANSFIRWNLYTASALIKIFSDRLLLVRGWQGIQFCSSPAYSQKSVRYERTMRPNSAGTNRLRGNELVCYQRYVISHILNSLQVQPSLQICQPIDYKTKVILRTPALSVLLKRRRNIFYVKRNSE